MVENLNNQTGNREAPGAYAASGSYPAEWVESVLLRDGMQVMVRPIRADDAARLQAGFDRLSAQSIYMRFLQTFKELPEKQAREFATVDYHKRMALVASIMDGEQEQLIGVARYSMVGEAEPGVAESAIVVADEYQNRGLGTLLLDRLVRYARTQGITTFLATVHQTNAQIMRFIQRSGFPFQKKILEPGVWELHIRIAEGDEA